MGWTGCPTNLTTKAFILQEFNKSNVKKYEAKGKTVYLAIEPTPGEVTALVILVEKKRGYITYKDMSEKMMPFSFEASEDLLDILTITGDSGANEWRNLCRQNNQRKKKAKTVIANLIAKTSLKLNTSFKVSGYGFNEVELVLFDNQKKKWIVKEPQTGSRFTVSRNWLETYLSIEEV